MKKQARNSTSKARVTALDLLTDQHREVEQLFDAVVKSEDLDDRGELCTELCDKLAVHATIEEKIFYPGVKVEQTEDILQESVEEHLQVKRLVADLLRMRPDDDTFLPAIKVLEEEVSHHVEEEEGELFPKVKKLFERAHLEALAQEMVAMVTELEGEEPRLNVPEEIDSASPV